MPAGSLLAAGGLPAVRAGVTGVTYLASSRVDPPAIADDRALALLLWPHQAAPPSLSSSTISASTTSSSWPSASAPGSLVCPAACDWA